MSPTLERHDSGATAQRRLLGAGSVVAIGLVIEMGSQFARTMLLARLLGATEFGVVISISTLAALVEMLSFIGIDRYIVYSPEGGEPRALGVAHTLALLRGVLSAAIVATLAWPTAATMGESAYALSFVVVAVGPLLRGASHLGVVQMQRSSRFWPAAAADAGGAVLGLLAAGVAALVAPDYRAILWGLSAQATGGLVLSHIFAYRIPYAICFDPVRIRGALRFGLPLLLNGLALAAAFQLDRMAVGAWLGVLALGIYELSITLLVQPITLLSRLATAILQPHLSAAWHGGPSAEFPSLIRQLARYSMLFGATGAAVTVCVGAPALRRVFGASYSTSDAFFVLMAGVVLTRIHRNALNLIGLAIGRTSDMMVSNIVGAIALPAMIGAFYLSHNLTSAAFGTLIGDLLAFAVIEAKLSWQCGGAHRAIRHGMAFATILTAVLAAWVLLSAPPLWLRAAVAAISLIAPASILLARRVTQDASIVPP